MILLAILIPPLYFFLRKKTGPGLITGALLVLSFFLALTMILLPVSLILWLCCAIWALRDNRRKEIGEHSDTFGSKIAEKMQTTPKL